MAKKRYDNGQPVKSGDQKAVKEAMLVLVRAGIIPPFADDVITLGADLNDIAGPLGEELYTLVVSANQGGRGGMEIQLTRKEVALLRATSKATGAAG